MAKNETQPTSLNFEDVAELPKGTRQTKDNPYVAPLSQSYSSKSAKAVTVADDTAAKKAQNSIRNAAQRLGIGARIVVEQQDNGQVRVMFQGQDKRAYEK